MTLEKYKKQIGQNLKDARKKSGLRQIDIEEKIGLTYRYYQTIEAGRANVTIKTLYELSKLFKTPVEALVKVK